MIKNTIRKTLDCFNLQLIRTYPRSMIRFMDKKKDMVGIEIGTFQGKNAKSIFKICDIKRIYLIDPYDSYEDYHDNLTYHLKEAKKKAHNRLKDYEDKIVWVEKKSEDAVNDVKEKVDFIYIDGNHSYEYTKKDIQLYWKTLKFGGVMGGDNFNDTIDYGVADAVIEFVVKNKLKLNLYQDDWWVVKQ